MTNRDSKRMGCAGFSMIEVLVASSILVVIVMMLAMLFQQTSLAWRTGVRRANSFMQVRSAIGAIQRDAAAAVDARSVPQELKDLVGGGQQNFSGFPLQFYTLNGTGFENNKTDETPLRSLSYITYNTSGQRTETILKGDGTVWKKTASNVLKFLQKRDSKNTLNTHLSFGEVEFGDFPQTGLPLFFTMKVNMELGGNGYDIGAASAGPDKIWNTKDDIRTWTEK